MAATIPTAPWLAFMQSEYLQSFIRQGGSAIKFVVPVQPELRSGIDAGITASARAAGYVVASISADVTRVHMIDQIFFRLAEHIPWQQLSDRINRRLAAEHGYPAAPADGPEPLLERLATANSIEPEFLTMEARRWVTARVLREPLLSKEFRIAATHLCLASMFGGEDGTIRYEVITDWLTGRNRSVSAVKPFQIYSKVTRHNARHLLVSLLHWIRFAGLPGLVILLDTSRVTSTRNPHDGLLFYSKAQMLDAYEVLRQFVDATDRMKSCLLVVMPSAEFLDLESGGRGMGAYSALRYRVYDEVHDQRLVNPMGALIRIGEREQAA